MKRTVDGNRGPCRRDGSMVALDVLDRFQTREGELVPALLDVAIREACYLSGLGYGQVRQLAVGLNGRCRPRKKPRRSPAGLEVTAGGTSS